ncbi:uncharacterized protein E0L32_003501 [Thyridium curvatum]|uniref:Uncharacterized protein n=1 Tax=Thyridium curvatum TaxID=1093900 RepID=A0A507BHU0_9PEZI|nr:uncharacterized protein E0L32_003501 [Thyridium curvatum]TPX16939.1 hypothetical protein E0L32_003501 [Thyridium curvatum]
MASPSPSPHNNNLPSPASSSSSPAPHPSSAPAPVTTPATPASIPQTLWRLRVPLHITHPSRPNTPFVASVPRFSYLALLLPRLRAFFGADDCSSFHHEEVQLRNLPVGLLVDMHRPQLPWRLVVGDGDEWHIGDTFLNGAKEADFVRNGNAKQIMGMSKEDTTALWNAVQDNDHASFARINTRLLNAPTALKHIPLRIYIPSPAPPTDGGGTTSPATAGEFKVMQVLVPPRVAANNRKPPSLLPFCLSIPSSVNLLIIADARGTNVCDENRQPAAAADAGPGPQDPPAGAVPQQPRPRAGRRRHARGARALLGAARGADARGRLPGRLGLSDCGAAVTNPKNSGREGGEAVAGFGQGCPV